MERYRPTDEPLPTHDAGIGPQAVEIADSHPDPDVFLDTFNNQLDNAMMIDAISRVRLSEVGPFQVPMGAPISDCKNQEAYGVTIDENFIRGMRKVQFALYEKLAGHSELGHELAEDTVRTWKQVNVESLMIEGKEVTL